MAMSSDLQRTLWNDIHMLWTALLLPRKEVQAPVSGEGEGGRWLCAQPVALGHSPVIGVHGPGHSAGNRPHLAADVGPLSMTHHLEQTHCILFLQNQLLLCDNHENPLAWEAGCRERLVLEKPTSFTHERWPYYDNVRAKGRTL